MPAPWPRSFLGRAPREEAEEKEEGQVCPLAELRRGLKGEKKGRGGRRPQSPPEPGAGRIAGEGGARQGPQRGARGRRSGASAEARGVSAVPKRHSVRSPSATRPPTVSGRLRGPFLGSLPGVQGSRKAPPADAPRPGSAATPGFSAQRAGSPGAQLPRPKLGSGDADPNAGHPLWRSPLLRGEPQPRSPQPRRLAPAPAAGTKGNKSSRKPPSRFRRHFTRRRRRAAGRWDREEGARRRPPQPLPPRAASRAAASASSAAPSAAPLAVSPPPALPSEVTETFSCSGEAGGGLCPRREAGRGAGVAARGRWTLTRRTEAGRGERGAQEPGAGSRQGLTLLRGARGAAAGRGEAGTGERAGKWGFVWT